MKNKEEVSKGVLDIEYAENRLKKPELVYRYKTRSQIVVNFVKKYLDSDNNLNILDYGAAEGLAILELDKIIPNNSIYGVEYSTELIERAPKLPDNIKLLEGDVCSLNEELKSRKYNVVVALALLEHLKDPLECLKQARDVMELGGIFIATSPSPMWDDISTKLGLLKDDQHETDMTKKIMIEMAEQADFEVLEYSRFMWAPISFLPYLKIKVSPKFSLTIDSFVRKIFIFNFLFVNQVIVLRKKK